MLTNQKLLWKPKSLEDDGRLFESRPLDESDDAELRKEVKEARMALIEQVQDVMLRSNVHGFKSCKRHLKLSPLCVFHL